MYGGEDTTINPGNGFTFGPNADPTGVGCDVDDVSSERSNSSSDTYHAAERSRPSPPLKGEVEPGAA